MSIKGGSLKWIEAAIARGDLLTAWASAHELPRGTLSLDHSLALVILASTSDPTRADRAADRWIHRATTEQPSLNARQLAEILDQLPDLTAVAQLGDVCEAQRWTQALTALEHLLPS